MGYETDAVHGSIKDFLSNLEDGREKEYEKYADYYDGRPECINKYFVKRHFENEERFKDRPKLSWPICPLIVDSHAEALAGEIQITVDDPDTQETWDEIAEHNQVGAFLREVATVGGTYGASGVKPLIFNDGTKQKKIEFEHYPPDTCKFVYERCSGGRSVKRYPGVGIITGYSFANDTVLPAHLDYELAKKLDFRKRTEYITKDKWEVFLDDRAYPISPFGEWWQPAQDGSNPYGEVMVSLFNGLESVDDFLGKSDLHNAIYDVQTINVLWSDLVYMHRMYVPVWVLKSKNPEVRKSFTAGIGTGMAIGPDEDFKYAFGGVDFENALNPVKVALEIMYSNAKVPAAAVGLGHLFRNQQVSGVSKEYEYKPTVAHALAKQPPFTRGIKQMVRQALKIAGMPLPYGQSKKVAAEYQITVEYTGDIIPTSQIERLEMIGKEILNGMKSVYQGMIEYHGWSKERAALEMDMIDAENKRHIADDLGFKHLVDIVQERQAIEYISPEARAEAEAVLFGAIAPMAGDVTAEPDEEESQDDERD